MNIFHWMRRFFDPQFQRVVFLKLSRKERLILLGGIALFITSGIILFSQWFNQNTQTIPIEGGTFKEGVVGQPTFINPIFSQANDADRDLSNLIFSSILKTNGKGGAIPDLASDIKVEEGGKVWNIFLKDNIFWHDGEQLTSDDVSFTIETIQNPSAHSPFFASWQGVSVERLSKRALRLTLKNPYYFFENNLKDLKIIPRHIFSNIPPENIRLSEYGLAPIGSGPFKFESVKKRRDGFITEFTLEANKNYYDKKPYLHNLVIKFYPNEEELVRAFNNHLIDGFGGISAKNLGEIYRRYQLVELYQPKYYALFFNQTLAKPLQDKNVRIALNVALNKQSIVKQVFDGKAFVAESPLLPFMKGYNKKANEPQGETGSLKKAEEILEMAGWQVKANNEDKKIRSKVIEGRETSLEFDLIVPQSEILIETAKTLEGIWSRIGVKVNLKVVSLNEIETNYFSNRSYQTIIFGNILSSEPDLFSFWHSSQKFPPGLNLALYENKTVDALIEKIRQDFNQEERLEDLASIQEIIAQDRPAVFLYSPIYLYVTSNKLKGLDAEIITVPSERFSDSVNWSVKQIKKFK